MIEVLVARVFSARNVAHLAHLRTKSYAQHMALGGFYEDVVGQIDKIVEVYQVCFGIVEIPELPAATYPKNIIGYLEKEAEWISNNRTKVAKGVTAIENLIDGLSEIYFGTLCKLKNLS